MSVDLNGDIVRLQPGDMIVLTLHHGVPFTARRFNEVLEEATLRFPDHKVTVVQRREATV